MNNTNNSLSRIIEILTKGSSGCIIIPNNPTIDAIAASTSLYLSLLKMGKNVTLVSSSKPNADLMATDKFQTNIGAGGDSLMVSFPYIEGSIDKVDYNIQGDNFNLVITPRPGNPKLNPNQVNFSYTGGTVDFFIIIDAPTLQSLGTVYTDNQNQFTGKDIINIDRHLTNAYFGSVNLVNKTISSVSELVLSIIKNLKIEVDKDIATNLYTGIASSTNNFTSYSVNADTFENIAVLLRAGAIKKIIRKPVTTPPVINQQPIRPTMINPSPSMGPESMPVTPIEKVELEKQPKDSQFEEKNPSDWLKPKIFKGSGLV